MRRLILFSLLCTLLLIPTAQGQLNIYGAAGGGAFVQGDQGFPAFFGGGDLKVMFDSATGISMFTRTMVLYSELDGQFQGAAEFFMTQKRLGIFRDLYIGFGPGFYYRVKNKADEQNVALRFILGSDFLGDVGIDLGVDYIPSIPIDNSETGATTRWLFHGAINLYPRL